MPPYVSAVMPAYNSALYIKHAILSILNQTFSNFEILVVDDGSTDNTADIVSSFNDSRIRLIRMECNSGVANATNIALREATGEYILFTDSDDISLPDRINTSVEFLDSHPELTGCGGQHILYNNIHMINSLRIRMKRNNILKFLNMPATIPCDRVAASCLFSGILFNPTVCFRASALRLMETWMDPAFNTGADDDFYERLQAAGARFAILPSVMICYRRRRGSNSRIFGNQGQTARVAISRRAVLRLLPETGEEELKLHSRLVLRDKTLLPDDLPALRAWLERLFEAGTGLYGASAMGAVIARHWQRACAIAATHSFFPALAHFLAFPNRAAHWREMASFLYQYQRRKFG